MALVLIFLPLPLPLLFARCLVAFAFSIGTFGNTGDFGNLFFYQCFTGEIDDGRFWTHVPNRISKGLLEGFAGIEKTYTTFPTRTKGCWPFWDSSSCHPITKCSVTQYWLLTRTVLHPPTPLSDVLQPKSSPNLSENEANVKSLMLGGDKFFRSVMVSEGLTLREAESEGESNPPRQRENIRIAMLRNIANGW